MAGELVVKGLARQFEHLRGLHRAAPGSLKRRHQERPLHLCELVVQPHLLLGRRVGEQNLIEQVTYLDPSEVPKGRLLPGYEALQAARDSLEPAGLEVIGVWRAESCCTEAAEGVQAEDVVAEISYLSVSVPALGSARFRSWRRVGGALIEESLK